MKIFKGRMNPILSTSKGNTVTFNEDSTMNIGPQFTVTAGIQENPSAKHIGSWTGLTIKEILEKVDLSNIIIDDDDKKEKIEKAGMVTEIDPESAYLGPKLWSRSIPMPLTGDNDDFAVMNIDDFLSENGFECNEAPSSPEGLGTFSNNIIQAFFFKYCVFTKKRKKIKPLQI